MLAMGLTAAANVSAATLSWDRNPEPDIESYVVSWGTAPGSYQFTVDVGTATSWVFTPPSTVSSYYFAVQARNVYGLVSPMSTEVKLTGYVPPPPVSGPATDFSGDGYADLLWQNEKDGGLVAWTMTGILRVNAQWLNPQRANSPNWKVAAIADFNKDGHPDLVWQNIVDGGLVGWYMNGLNLSAAAYMNPSGVADVNWKVAGAGDFNGDGNPDLLWQHQVDGGLVIWFMNGTTMTSAKWLTPSSVADQDWRVAAVADFNKDGKADLIWRHKTNGWLVVWMMNGAAMQTAEWVTPNGVTDPQWKLVAAKDFNNDGWADLLWQHQANGSLNVWLMNRITMVTAPWLEPRSVTDLAWKVVGAQ